jgi:arginine repressor
MARPKTNESTSKSDIVRAYLKTNSKASVNQIVEDLRSYGITPALAQKIKYKDGAKRGRGRKARSSEPAGYSASESASPTKADHIRRVAQGMGKRIRPRDVIAALAAEGITVSFAQVGQVLKNLGMRRRRGRRGAGASSVMRGSATPASETISLQALMAAKRLADQLGGVQAAKQAMDALAKLS